MTGRRDSPRFRRAGGAAVTIVVLMVIASCQGSTTGGEVTMSPLDQTAVTQVKTDTTKDAQETLGLLSAAGAEMTTGVGQWLSCDDTRQDFGMYSVTATFTVPAAPAETQLDPFVAPLEAAGWTTTRDTATMQPPPSSGKGLATFRNGGTVLEVTTTGGTNGMARYLGDCVQSDVFETPGFNFDVDQDTVPLG
jgi:hypothetical protein